MEHTMERDYARYLAVATAAQLHFEMMFMEQTVVRSMDSD